MIALSVLMSSFSCISVSVVTLISQGLSFMDFLNGKLHCFSLIKFKWMRKWCSGAGLQMTDYHWYEVSDDRNLSCVHSTACGVTINTFRVYTYCSQENVSHYCLLGFHLILKKALIKNHIAEVILELCRISRITPGNVHPDNICYISWQAISSSSVCYSG